ncbi:hypothetical protein CDD81_7189 [Ophiocordyceps australis]|uniref:Uncharacterized protein n=1 Tax=Ophiocordyceps australis TaxID=1399860 RepID=A0A2C5Y419_9HYPO|nr:hypothetical protein CDD81_7189 [Ophiocordyceps australis]
MDMSTIQIPFEPANQGPSGEECQPPYQSGIVLARNPFHLYDGQGNDCGVNGIFIGHLFIAVSCVIVLICYVIFVHNIVCRYVRQGLLARKRWSQRSDLDIELGNESEQGQPRSGHARQNSSQSSSPAPPYDRIGQPPPVYDYSANNTCNASNVANTTPNNTLPRHGFDIERPRRFQDAPVMTSWSEWIQKREQRDRRHRHFVVQTNDSYLLARQQLPARALLGGDLDRYEVARTDRMRREGLCPPVSVAHSPNYSYIV